MHLSYASHPSADVSGKFLLVCKHNVNNLACVAALAECVVQPFVIRSEWVTGAVIACWRYKGVVLSFIDGSMVLIVAPLMLALIVDPVGLGVIDDDPCATRSGNFHHDARQSADHRQPKRENKKHFHRRCC